MPNRMLREGILTSERVNALDWEAEVFYRRLMSVVDDFGRYSAHPALLRAALYPLKLEIVRDATIERLLKIVEQASLVRVYEVESKRYVELLDFKQQVRAKTSKYPSFDERTQSTCAAHAKQLFSDAHLDVVGDVDVDGGEKSSERLTHSEPLSGFAIPLNDGSEYAVTARTFQEWVKSFPAVDVGQELREMRAWAMANTAKRKTKRGVDAFIVRWLSKAQDTPSRTRSVESGAGIFAGAI